MRPIGRHQDLARRFVANIRLWDVRKLQMANASPLSFAYTLAELLCAEKVVRFRDSPERFRAKAFKGNRDFVRYSFEVEASLYEFSLIMHRDSLARSLESLTCFQLKAENDLLESTKKQRKAVLLDYKTELGAAKDQLQHFYTFESRSINHRATVNALSSVEQSESIGRLTFLAFIFIPRSFVAALFGMNLQDLGSGTASIQSSSQQPALGL